MAETGTPATRRGLSVAQIAEVCHEANRAYCETIGDYSQKPWEQAEEWQRDSMVRGVEAMLSGRAKTPEEQHLAWCEHKVAEGWRFGHVKDADAKTHPALLPYDQLPIEQKRKDYLSRAIVTALSGDA